VCACCQGIEDVLKQCIDSIGAASFFQLLSDYTVNAFVLFGEVTRGGGGGSDAYNGSAGPADWRSLDVVMFAMVRVMDVLRHDAQQPVLGSQAPTSVTLLLKIIQYVLSPIAASGSQSHQQAYANIPTPFFLSCCNLLSAATFLLTPPSSGQHSLVPPSPISPFILSPFQELFPCAVEFFFYCLTAASNNLSRRVQYRAAEGLLRMSTHGIHNIVDQSDCRAPISAMMTGIVHSTAALFAPTGRPIQLKSLLLVLQSVTVVIASCPSHNHRSELLSTLVTPLLTQLEANLSSPSWCAAAAFVRNLQSISQIIRYVSPLTSSQESSSSGDMAYIVTFLGALWPLLDHIATLMSTSEASTGNPVLDCIFAIYKNAVTNMPTLLAAQPGVIEEMSQRCVSAFFLRRNAEAIDCAAGIVEAFPTSSSIPEDNTFVLLEQILQHTVQGMSCDGFLEAVLRELMAASSGSGGSSLACVRERVRQGWSFGDEPESMEHFFNFVYQYFLCSPQILLHLSAQAQQAEDERQGGTSGGGAIQLSMV
jgi:hypothetical protein